MEHYSIKADAPEHHGVIIGFYNIISDTSNLCSKSYNIINSVISDLNVARSLGHFDNEDKLLDIKHCSEKLSNGFRLLKERNCKAALNIALLEQHLSSEIQSMQSTIKGLSGGLMQLTKRNKYTKMKLLLADLDRLFKHMGFLLHELDRLDNSLQSILDNITDYIKLTENSIRNCGSNGESVEIIADKMLAGTQTLQYHLKNIEAGVNKTALQFRHNFFHILLA